MQVEYHSAYWMVLVSNGWVTMFVDDGIATMIKPFVRRYGICAILART